MESSPSSQQGFLSGIKGLAERGLGWIRSRVLAPMRRLAARGWSGVKSFGGRISTAYQQANPQIWDIFQPEHLMFRMARNQRTQLFAQAIQAEQSQRAIATDGSQSGETAPVNEPSQLQRLDGIAQTIESGAETFFNIRKELIEGAVVGDFKENPTIWNTIGQIGMGFVPYAGQAADVRDLVASVQKLHKSGYKDPWEWFNLVLVGVGFIPGIGDAIKAGGRAAKGAIRRSLTKVLTKADNFLRPVLGRAKGMLQGASRQGRRFMQWASRQGTRLRRGVRQFGQKAVNFSRTAGQRARGLVNRLKGRVRGLLGNAKQTANNSIGRGRGLLGQAPGKFLGMAQSAFNQAKNRVSQAMKQVKAAMQRGKGIAQRVRSKVAQARQRATSLMRNFTQSAIQKGGSLLQSGRRLASQLRNKASQVGRNLVQGARQRVEGLVRNGVKFAKERAIPFIKQKLGGVKHRVKDFLQDRWNRLKERLGIGKAGKEGAERGAKESDNAARKAAELPAAIAKAKAITEFNDAANTPVPGLIGALNVSVKSKYPWIKRFEARPKGKLGHYSIYMIASEHPIDDDYSDDYDNHVNNIVSNPKSIWGKSAEDIAEEFRGAGYDVTIEQSTRGSKLSTQIRIKGHPEITNIQFHPGGGRHVGSYYKISTSTQGKIKVVDPSTYKSDPREKVTIIEI